MGMCFSREGESEVSCNVVKQEACNTYEVVPSEAGFVSAFRDSGGRPPDQQNHKICDAPQGGDHTINEHTCATCGFAHIRSRSSKVLYVDSNRSVTAMDGSSLAVKGNGILRCVVVSDTHERHEDLTLPDGDMLIHCGDILCESSTKESEANVSQLNSFNNWLGQQTGDASHRIVIGGNHDGVLQDLGAQKVQEVLSNAKYLFNELYVYDDSSSEYENVRIFASPHSVQGDSKNIAFQIGSKSDEAYVENTWREELLGEIDIVVTHGSEGLFGNWIREVRPRLHLFGHAHFDYGVRISDDVIRVNASSCNENYCVVNAPVIVDLPRRKKIRKPTCEKCNQEFSSKWSLEQHRKRIHASEDSQGSML